MSNNNNKRYGNLFLCKKEYWKYKKCVISRFFLSPLTGLSFIYSVITRFNSLFTYNYRCCSIDFRSLKKLSEESLTRQPEEVFDIICKLGEGSYGSVYKALHKESDQVR